MFYDNLKALCESNGTTVTAVLKKLKISTSKGTAWKSGAVPKGGVLSRLAAYFNVSTDYLLGNTDNPHSSHLSNQQNLAPDEKKLLTKYRALDYFGRKAVDELLSTEYERCTKLKSNPPSNISGKSDNNEYESVPIAARDGDGKPIELKKKKGKSIHDLPDYRGGRR